MSIFDREPPTRQGPLVTLFDGKTCKLCVLVHQGIKGTFAIMDASSLACEELDNIGAHNMLPDGGHDGETEHKWCIVTFKYIGNEDPDLAIVDYIAVDQDSAFMHLNPITTFKLWVETNPCDVGDLSPDPLDGSVY